MSVGSTISAPGSTMPEQPPSIRNESLMASAGSGKTFALSSRYLQLILMGAEPGSILASTFTRLAAGEIRDRILERLAGAAIHEHKRRELAGATHQKKLSEDAILDALARLTRNMHRLQVRTLDSFFASVVKCFALELGIDPATAIVDADLDRAMRREAIEMMLDERDPQPLIDLLRVLADGSDERRVTETIDAEMRGLYELYREAPAEAWEAVSFWKPLDDDELQHAIEHLIASPPSEDGRFIKAHAGDCECAQRAGANSADDWLSFLCRGLAKAIVFGGGSYHRKRIEQSVLSAYEPLIDHAKAVLRNSIAGRTRSTRDLLERFHSRYEEAKSRHKAMTFADITAKMSEARTLGAADDICFRLDATLRHILLDEMQDTSRQQWMALEEIVRSIISEPPPTRSFFCVGDVKQSIYGWREACPEILAQMPTLIKQLGGDPQSIGEGAPLIKNWRSSPIVLETVDRVLLDTADNPAMEAHLDAARAWDEAYLPHTAHHKDEPGYVELRIAPRAGEDDDRQPIVRLQYAADLIERLYADAPQATIGVLTRTNKTVNRLLYELGPSRKNLDVAGRGGGALTDSAAVNSILDFLRVADHPEHTIAAFNVVHSPLGAAIGFTNLDQRWRFSREVRRALLDHGYAKAIGRWIAEIGEKTDARQLRRLIQLQQLAAQFDSRPRQSLRTDDFLAMVDASTAADPGAARVQVMTVHQAKGLEFDIVVLADLDEAIVRTNGMKMVVERDPFGNITRIARHIKQDVWSLFDDLLPMFEQQVMRMARESMCLLYVAMTRARNALHMVIDPPKENARSLPKTLASIVRCRLAEEPPEPESVAYQSGDERWWEASKRRNVETSKGQTTKTVADDDTPGWRIELTPARGDIPRGRSSESASRLRDSDSETNIARSRAWLMRLPDQSARDRGVAIHAMFESIEWIEDFDPDRESLARIALHAAPRRGPEWASEQVDSFLKMLEKPAVREALSRGNSPAQVWRELPHARLVDGAIRREVIDRLTAFLDQTGRVVSASILDFKTGDVESDGLYERTEHSRPQLEAYRTTAAAMLNVDESKIDMKLLFVSIGEVVCV